jgi:glutamine cyclotransferase
MRRIGLLGLLGLAAQLSFAALAGCNGIAARETPIWTARVIATHPHDPGAFTQGLVVHRGELFEGTGLYGRSSVRRVDLETGRVEALVPLPAAYFGEGITIIGDRLFQLTWQNQTAIIYDVDSLKPIEVFNYTGEGWGLTHDGTHLLVSDGSASIQFWDPASRAVIRRIEVSDDGEPIARLNELEYIEGEIWANIWYQDRIARISPETGQVLGWIDLSGLYTDNRRGSEDVLNGIAFNPDTRQLFVTGKNWPQLFEIELVRN